MRKSEFNSLFLCLVAIPLLCSEQAVAQTECRDLTTGDDRLNVANPTGSPQDFGINNINAKNCINALAGNDIVDAGNGSDTLSGGDGSDILFGGGDGDTVNGDDGNDIIVDTAGTLNGGTGVDVFVINGGTVDGGGGNDAFLMQKTKPSGPINDDGPGDINSDYLAGLFGGNSFDRIHATMDDHVLAVRNFSVDQSIEMITAFGIAKEDTDELTELEALRDRLDGGDNNLSDVGFSGFTLSGGNNKDNLDFSATIFRGVEAVNLNNGPDTVTTAKDHRGTVTDYAGGRDGDCINIFLTEADFAEIVLAGKLGALLAYLDSPNGMTLDLSDEIGLTATEFEKASITDGDGNGFVRFKVDGIQYVIGDDGDNRIKNFDTRCDQILVGNDGADDFRFEARDSDDGLYLEPGNEDNGGNATIVDLDFAEGDNLVFSNWEHTALQNPRHLRVENETDLLDLIEALNSDDETDFTGTRNGDPSELKDVTEAFEDDGNLVLRIADNNGGAQGANFEEIIIEGFGDLIAD